MIIRQRQTTCATCIKKNSPLSGSFFSRFSHLCSPNPRGLRGLSTFTTCKLLLVIFFFYCHLEKWYESFFFLFSFCKDSQSSLQKKNVSGIDTFNVITLQYNPYESAHFNMSSTLKLSAWLKHVIREYIWYICLWIHMLMMENITYIWGRNNMYRVLECSIVYSVVNKLLERNSWICFP